MSAVRPQDVLFRAGGGTLRRLQTLCAAGAGRGVEVPYTHTRADATACASLISRDTLGYTASANVLRMDWPSGLVDASGIPTGGILSEGARATMLDNSNMEADNNGWLSVSGATISRDNARAFHGSWAEKIVIPLNTINCGGAALLRSGLKVPVTVGQAYSGSGWVYADPGSAAVGKLFKLSQQWFDAGGAFLNSQVITQVLVAGWQRLLDNNAVAPASTVTTHLLFCSGAGTDPTYTVWVDLPQIENATFASSAIPTGTIVLTRAADALTVPFNFGPQSDYTILARLARPPYADNVGALGKSPGIFSFGAGSAARIGAYFDPAARNIISVIDTATTDGTATVAIPAGNPTICIQYKNLTSGGQTSIDTGSASSGFGNVATAFSQFSSQTLRIGRYDDELFGVLGDLVVARGLFTRAEMLAIA